jgi:hypothetical protein
MTTNPHIKIKPMRWQASPCANHGRVSMIAETPIGEFFYFENADGSGEYAFPEWVSVERAESPQAAKRILEEEYERRIRECLE